MIHASIFNQVASGFGCGLNQEALLRSLKRPRTFLSAWNNQLRTGADKGNSTVLLKQSDAMAGDGDFCPVLLGDLQILLFVFACCQYIKILHEISVLITLTLVHLCYRSTDVPPQPNSPTDVVSRVYLETV